MNEGASSSRPLSAPIRRCFCGLLLCRARVPSHEDGTPPPPTAPSACASLRADEFTRYRKQMKRHVTRTRMWGRCAPSSPRCLRRKSRTARVRIFLRLQSVGNMVGGGHACASVDDQLMAPEACALGVLIIHYQQDVACLLYRSKLHECDNESVPLRGSIYRHLP